MNIIISAVAVVGGEGAFGGGEYYNTMAKKRCGEEEKMWGLRGCGDVEKVEIGSGSRWDESVREGDGWDEMNLMFAHLKYLLTSTIASLLRLILKTSSILLNNVSPNLLLKAITYDSRII
nr:hypothetical protein [Tanacetum cinerariifolium]